MTSRDWTQQTTTGVRTDRVLSLFSLSTWIHRRYLRVSTVELVVHLVVFGDLMVELGGCALSVFRDLMVVLSLYSET